VREEWILISRGAEAEVYKGVFYGHPAVRKLRFPKEYRHPLLDIKIRRGRTRREARLLSMAKAARVPVPYVLYVDEDACALIIEYIEGELLRRAILKLEVEHRQEQALKYIRLAGAYLGRLHDVGVIHGDFTTSNLILTPSGRLFVIDFGLGYYTGSKDPEDYAVELRVFSRGLEIYHFNYYQEYWSEFLSGYESEYGNADVVIKRVKEIFMRGRYVAERRTKWRFTLE